MLLAIDTSTRQLSLALHDGHKLLAEHTWISNNNHTIQLTPTIQQIFERTEVPITALTALAVSIGPGSYTGLRIGVATAKGMALAHKLPLVGLTSLDVLAAGQPYYQSGAGLIAVVQAGRGRIIVNTYRWRKNQWQTHTEPRIMTWQELIESIDGKAFITGEVDEKGQKIIAEMDEQEDARSLTIVPGAGRLRRAGFMAEMALEKLNEAEDVAEYAPELVVPIYLKSEG